MRIFDLLPTGKENAISSRKLCEIVGVNDRQLRKMILNERESGLLIMSNAGKGGYYLPATESEIDDFIRMNEKQAFTRLKMTKSARDYKKRMRGQQKLNLEE